MPCYTQTTANVQFGKNTDTALLAEALKASGYRVLEVSQDGITGWNFLRFNRATGELLIRTLPANLDSELAKIKRAYSEQVILKTAKTNGWKVSWETNSAGNKIAQVERMSR